MSRLHARPGRHAAFAWAKWMAIGLSASATFAAATGANPEKGRAIYEGVASPSGAPAACVSCHRRSGLGSYEGGLAAPPVAARYLFQPYDPDKSRFFTANARHRVRPAYDDQSLATLLRDGLTPDGTTVAASMPRYALDDAAVADLAAYLRALSVSPPPGLDAHTIRIATVTTPDSEPARAEAMLVTLRRFVEQKNGRSRHEIERARQAEHTREMVMYTKYRVWQLDHWALSGAPHTWLQQLEAMQRGRPVFALVAGLGRGDWSPVDAFCERAQLPCLLPLVDAGATGLPQHAFYSLHYHDGIEADTRLLARQLRDFGAKEFQLWSEPGERAVAQHVESVLEHAGFHAAQPGSAQRSVIVSVLSPRAHRARLEATLPAAAQPVAWLPGTHALSQDDLNAVARMTRPGWIVTPMRSGAELDRQLARARTWLRSQGLADLPEDVAASTVHAATVFGDALKHSDAHFTPEYMLELLEHGLEGMVPWSPYPRLAIGPGQRVASKGSFVGTLRDGRIEWAWQSTR